MWVIDVCSVYVICWPMGLWTIDACLLPCASLLSTSYRGFTFSWAKRPHDWSHCTACSSLNMPHSCISLYPCIRVQLLLLGLSLSFFVNLENTHLFSVSWFGHLCSWKALHTKFDALALCSHRSPGSMTFNAQLMNICLLVCLHQRTESPSPLTCLFKWLLEQHLECDMFSMGKWINRSPMDLTSMWHPNKHVCMSMYKGTCMRRGP